jgi:integrase
MKGRRHHRVPLSTAAVAVLDSIQQKRHNSDDYVFHSDIPGHKALGRNAPLTTIQALVAEVNEKHGLDISSDITAHGFRSAFKTWGGTQTKYAREVIEDAVAHTVTNQTEESYWRADYFERRRPLMEAWARFCAGENAEVINIKRRRKVA